MPPRRPVAVLVAACAVLLAIAAPAFAVRPPIHAHRGGSIEFGKPVYPENTMPAFRAAARRGFVLELDVKLTKRPRAGGHPRRDARPHHAVHRPGERAHFAELRANCPSDIVGTDGNFVQLAAERPPPRAASRG